MNRSRIRKGYISIYFCIAFAEKYTNIFFCKIFGRFCKNLDFFLIKVSGMMRTERNTRINKERERANMLWEELDKELIFLDLDVSSSDEVMEIVGGKLVETGYCKPDYVEALKKREAEFPTGIDTGNIGIAIPHTAVDHINKGKIAIARLKKNVSFQQMGNDDEMVNVKLVFMLAVDDPNQHLAKLQSIVEVIQDETTLGKFLNAKAEQDIIESMKEKETA